MAFSLGEYGDIFLEEADEQLQELNQNLIELEKDPESEESINNIFRAAHSLKSSAAFVGLNDLSDLAHKMENLLQGIRDKTLAVTPEIVNVIFKCFDVITNVIESVASGEEPDQDMSGIIKEIQNVAQKGDAPPKDDKNAGDAGGAPAVAVPQAEGEIPKLDISGSQVSEISDAINSGKLCYEIAVHIDLTAQMRWVKAQLVLNNLEGLGDLLMIEPAPEDIPDQSDVLGFRALMLTDVSSQDIEKACDIDQIERVDIRALSISQREGKTVLSFGAAAQEPQPVVIEESDDTSTGDTIEESADQHEPEEETKSFDDTEVAASRSNTADHDRKKSSLLKTVKVSIEKLDQLLNNVGELVVANSGFYKLYDEIKGNPEAKAFASEFKNRIEQMARIAKDLQNGIMNTRMVPIGQVFSRFSRLVRDLTLEFGKDVELKVSGEETELDKKVIDVIGEPLLHLLRNAVDHGIESPEDRAEAGKSAQAVIHLNAYQGGNQIFVEVSDDGKGLDINVIKKKAIEKGLVTPEMLDNMDDSEVYAMIFAPGFSTAKKITDISGRGVGMSVVRQTVEELNGNVSIETKLGQGTKFIMAFPLTLAIIPAIMVRVRRELYAIPLSDVLDTIKILPSDITTIEGHEVINFRGEILSVVRLNRFLGLRSAIKEDQKSPVVVVNFANRKIGLIVDHLDGKQEVVIKSLEQNYTTVQGLAGASILGDGSICLILDIGSMVNKLINDQDRYAEADDSYLDIDADDYEHGYGGITEKEGAREAIGNFKVEAHEAEPVKTEAELNKAKEQADEPEGLSEPSPDYMEKLNRKESTLIFDVSHDPVEDAEAVVVPETSKTEKESDQVKEQDREPELSHESVQPAETIDEQHGEGEKTVTETGRVGSIDREHRETTPVSAASSDEVDDKVRSALNDFKSELKNNIESAMEAGDPNDHMNDSLNVTKQELKEFQVLANTGAANAAESLSRILSKRIDLAIPEVSVKPISSIPQFMGDEGGQYVGIMLSILGDIKGSIFLVLTEESSLDLVNILYHSEDSSLEGIDDDKISALKEIGNIIGSSVINVFAEKTGLFIHPSIPTFVLDYLTAMVDSILIMHNIVNDYAIVMDTAFFFEDDRVVGSLLFMPEADSLKILVDNVRSHVPAN